MTENETPAPAASRFLHVLLVEDDPNDADLIWRQLQHDGFQAKGETVDNEADFLAALARKPHLVLADWTLPRFSGARALELLNASSLEIPFILISGTVGEETAVAAMKEGASDYLLKDRLARLTPAVHHALEKMRLRREQRLATEVLAATEAKYRGIVEGAAEGIFQITPEGRFLMVNPALARIAGYASGAEMIEDAEAFGEQWFGDDDRRQTWHRRLAEEGSVRDFEAEVRRQDGTLIWTSANARAVRRTSDGAVACFEGTVVDITSRRQLEAQFRQAQRMEAIGALAGGIAHDFNNVLSAIVGYTELAAMRVRDNPLVAGHLHAVLQSASRGSALVRQIVAFSRHREQPRSLVHLRHILAEPLNLLRSTLPSTIQLDSSFDPDVPPILADPAQIHQVVMNLCTNAAQSMEDHAGRIEVRLAQVSLNEAQAAANPNLRAGKYVTVTVADTGRGMNEETIAHIFEPFFTTQNSGSGRGLGLAAVHGTMRAHQGAITVTSDPGKGSAFTLYFPAQETDIPLQDIAPAVAPRGQGECILFVDDQAALVKLGRSILEELGYFPIVHQDAEAALLAVRQDPARFAAVITDLTMPHLTGMQLARELVGVRPGLPVLLITGNLGDLNPEQVSAAGIAEVLLKPLTLHAVGSALYRVLAK